MDDGGGPIDNGWLNIPACRNTASPDGVQSEGPAVFLYEQNTSAGVNRLGGFCAASDGSVQSHDGGDDTIDFFR